MRVRYTKDIPEELHQFIAQRIEPFLPLMPNWCDNVIISYAQSKEDVMTCEVQYEYRTVVLFIHPLFLEDADWQQSVLHEIGHAMLKPLIQFGDKLIEHFAEESMQKFLLDQYAYLEEQIAEDISIFAKKLVSFKTLPERSEADETRPCDGQVKARRGKRRDT